MRITRAVPSVVRSLLYRFLKVPSSLYLTSARSRVRAQASTGIHQAPLALWPASAYASGPLSLI